MNEELKEIYHKSHRFYTIFYIVIDVFFLGLFIGSIVLSGYLLKSWQLTFIILFSVTMLVILYFTILQLLILFKLDKYLINHDYPNGIKKADKFLKICFGSYKDLVNGYKATYLLSMNKIKESKRLIDRIKSQNVRDKLIFYRALIAIEDEKYEEANKLRKLLFRNGQLEKGSLEYVQLGVLDILFERINGAEKMESDSYVIEFFDIPLIKKIYDKTYLPTI